MKIKYLLHETKKQKSKLQDIKKKLGQNPTRHKTPLDKNYCGNLFMDILPIICSLFLLGFGLLFLGVYVLWVQFYLVSFLLHLVGFSIDLGTRNQIYQGFMGIISLFSACC